MSRKRLPRAEEDLYARHSERIVRALELRALDFLSYGVLSFLVDKISLPGRGGEALYTLEELARALAWPLTVEPLRRRLHGLRDADWITFEDPRRGPEAPWIFRLSGAEVDAKRDESLVSFDQTFLAGRPGREESVSAQADGAGRKNLEPEPVSEPSEFPRRARAEQSRAKTETENRCSEETKPDHVEGETTARATDPAITDRLVAKINGGRPVHVEQAADGSLVWSREPQDGEQSAMDDFQALVDAGVAEWIEPNDGGKR